MKITAVEASGRKKVFVVRTRSTEYAFPFAKLRLHPTKEDPVAEVFPDPELGKEAFTYRLLSGAEDTVHVDAVREFARDPNYLHELFVHQLTVEALKGLEESGLGKRQVSRQLGTSASQLYRLLDPDNRKKSIGQMLALLHLLDRDVSLVVTDRKSESSSTKSRMRSMAHKRVTGRKAASSASKTLQKKGTSMKSKSAAGSTLSQRKAPKKTTGKKAASAASKTLRDRRTSETSKSAAGSTLSQRHGKTKSTGKVKSSKK